MDKKKASRKIIIWVAGIAGVSLALGALVQWILNVGEFWPGFLAGALIIFLIGVALFFAWRGAGGGKTLGWMMLAAVAVRLILSVFLAWGLPLFGYEEKPQLAGFVFEDAFRRDENAWALAQSDEPLTRAFSDEYETDQYGGMLALSAFIYRTISPDAHRPVLISIAAAGVMTLSLPFFLTAVRRQFSRRGAVIAGWILALYPEGVLLGAAQMREPFYILFLTVIFWAAVHWLYRSKLKLAIPAFVLSAICLLLFSFRVGLPLLGAVAIWIWTAETPRIKKTWIKVAGWAAVGLSAAAILLFFSYWIDAVIHWDTLKTIESSGMVQYLLESLPEFLHLPFIIVYGIFQPVLPAAIGVPAPWIWKSLGLFRAVGWYAVLPLKAYAAFRLWRDESKTRKRWLLIMVLVVWAWILISSLRAGGDQWDNPRYRTILLPWIAVIGGWAIDFALKTRDRWLTRLLIIEGVFVAFFTEWYISRYLSDIPRLEMPVMVLIILVLSLGVVICGWIWDRKHPGQTLTGDKEKL
jgi:hypothetical protein